MADKLISKIPDGPLAEKWTKRKSEIHLVSPNNKRKLEIIVVGTGLGGASAAASLGELGYNVKIFCISDSSGECSLCRHLLGLNPSLWLNSHLDDWATMAEAQIRLLLANELILIIGDWVMNMSSSSGWQLFRATHVLCDCQSKSLISS